jgi:16S rRNA (guanine1207-N2)-methyltransferase
VELSVKNAKINGVGGVNVILSDGFKSIQDTGYTLILSNPPYHADFSVPTRFIEKSFNRLLIGAKMVMVTKRKDWYKNKLTAIFGGVKIIETGGYFMFTAEKRGTRYAKKLTALNDNFSQLASRQRPSGDNKNKYPESLYQKSR